MVDVITPDGLNGVLKKTEIVTASEIVLIARAPLVRAAREPDIHRLLNETIDRDTLANLLEAMYSTKQASSHDRRVAAPVFKPGQCDARLRWYSRLFKVTPQSLKQVKAKICRNQIEKIVDGEFGMGKALRATSMVAAV